MICSQDRKLVTLHSQHSQTPESGAMLGLQLREDFQGKRLKGTAVDYKDQADIGALDITATDCLKIVYPSHDLLKTIKATGPGQSRPVVLLGSRGQGKSHLMGALFHLCHNPAAGSDWLAKWAAHLKKSQIGDLRLRGGCFVIAESLHRQRHKHIWDVLIKNHPRGQLHEAKWSGMGGNVADVLTLHYGGLSLLEVFVPFIELSR